MSALSNLKNTSLWKFAVKVRYMNFRLPRREVLAYKFKTSYVWMSLMRLKYYTPKKEYAEIPLSPRAEKWLKEFAETGVLILDEFADIAKYINEEYIDQPENKYFVEDCFNQRCIDTGVSFSKIISLKDPKLDKLLFHEDMFAMLNKHYKRQAYYRDFPEIRINQFVEGKNTPDISTLMHIDTGLDQVTFMLLLSDLTEDDTHMEVALKSCQVKHRNADRFQIEKEEIEKNFEMMQCVGKAGTLFLFRGGLTYHRAVVKSGSTRKIMHCNFTTGHHINPKKSEDYSNETAIQDKPFYIRHMVDKLQTTK